MCALASVVYLDHVKVILISENSVHLAVQLLESALDGVRLQHVIGPVLAEEMVACKTKESLMRLEN